MNMAEFGALLWIWFVHSLIALVLSAPIIYLGSKRVHWHYWELLVLVVPFLAWSLLSFSPLATGKKSLANLSEPFYFAVAIPIAAIIRISLGSRGHEGTIAALLIAAVTILSTVVFFTFPSLPE
jgi:hypothetical protein